MYLAVHLLYLSTVSLDLLVLTADLTAGTDPADDIVLIEEAHQKDEESSHNDGIADERSLLRILAIKVPPPYVPELSPRRIVILMQK